MKKIVILGLLLYCIVSCSYYPKADLMVDNRTEDTLWIEIKDRHGKTMPIELPPNDHSEFVFRLLENQDAYKYIYDGPWAATWRHYGRPEIDLEKMPPSYVISRWSSKENIYQFVDFNLSEVQIVWKNGRLLISDDDKLKAFVEDLTCNYWLLPSKKLHLHFNITRRKLKKWKEKYE